MPKKTVRLPCGCTADILVDKRKHFGTDNRGRRIRRRISTGRKCYKCEKADALEKVKRMPVDDAKEFLVTLVKEGDISPSDVLGLPSLF